MKDILFRYLKIIFKVPFQFFLLPFYFLIFVCARILNIKFIYLNFLRIGHMIGDGYKSYYELNSIASTRNIYKTIFVVDFQTCNIYLRDYFFKLLPISRILSIFKTINYYMPDNLQLFIEAYKYGSSGRDPNNLFRKYKPPSFDLIHILETKEELKKYGWRNENIASLMFRDNAYLKNFGLYANSNKLDFSYHDYRDSDINCYEELIEHVSKENFVARIGHSSHKSLKQGSKRVDFTKVKKKAYLDYIIPTLSEFIISTGTGIDTIGYVFNIPLMHVNAVPVSFIQSSCNLYYLPKKLFYLDNGKELTLRDYITSCYLRTDEFFKNGIGFHSRSGSELIEYFEEFKKLFLFKKDGREAYERLTNEDRDLICEFYNLRSSLVSQLGDISIDNVYKNSFPSPIWLKSIKI